MKGNYIDKLEVHVHDGGQANLALDNGTINAIVKNDEGNIIRRKIKSRTQEYADKWNENMFLNNFDKRDENAGVNIKLREVYLDEHLPYYIFMNNRGLSNDLKTLLSEYVDKKGQNEMLLILGQPGIGKSTLITWITANFVDSISSILVYKFAVDLKRVEWQKPDVLKEILDALHLSQEDLNGKILILDGFDEVNVGENRRNILDSIHENLINKKDIRNFSLIITCRENYIQESERLQCKHITLQPWGAVQIKSFCTVFQEKTNVAIPEQMVEKIIENREVLGIPLILYMVLALNIFIENEGSIVDIYDKIFSLEGGIYDRCIENKWFDNVHRIGEIKRGIHQISREIAIWIFENNPEEAFIMQNEYENICNIVMQDNKEIKQDFLIGNYFRLVKHCEGIGTEKLYFIHRSIYEYFVAETICNSIRDALFCLTPDSLESFAGNISIYLRQGKITKTIGEYLEHKIIQIYDQLEYEKKEVFYQWWTYAVGKMMDVGMFFYSKKNMQDFRSIIDKEMICFLNLLEILRSLLGISKENYIIIEAKKRLLERYIRICNIVGKNYIEVNLSRLYLDYIDLSGADLAMVDFTKVYLASANLNRANLQKAVLRNASLLCASLKRADLREADLCGANLKGAKLEIADLRRAQLVGANLKGADLRGAELEGINLKHAVLSLAFLDESQVDYLKGKWDLREIRIYIRNTGDVVSYEKYCRQNQ